MRRRVSELEHLGTEHWVVSVPIAAPRLDPSLTAAELAVVEALAAGHTLESFAAARGVSPRTVRNQWVSARRKLTRSAPR